jgi:UDPglucose--hexose-1-phosphate uridylyltransferase
MSELRRDPLSDRWVVIAENRAGRPDQYQPASARRIVAPCPFCRGQERETPPAAATYVADGQPTTDANWQVRVVPNKYPAVRADLPAYQADSAVGETRAAIGAHEVIIESPQHLVSLSGLSDRQVELTFTAYQDRLVYWQRDDRLAYGLIFKNARAAGGASLEHTHSQLIATPSVPSEVARELACAERLLGSYGACAFCRLLDEEAATGARIVAEDEHYVALCPYASRFPYETWVLPRRHASRFEDVGRQPLQRLAHLVRELICRLEQIVSELAYNYWIHTAPWGGENYQRSYHWHLEIVPRLTRMAGFELGTGYFINPVSPEQAARRLRSASDERIPSDEAKFSVQKN